MCCTGGNEGSKHMVYSPVMLPVVSKLVRNMCFNAVMSLTSAVVKWVLSRGKNLHFMVLQMLCTAMLGVNES